MSYLSQLFQTVTRQRPTTVTDGYGNSIDSFISSATAIYKGRLDPGKQNEITTGRDTTVSDATLYLEPGADVTAYDRVVVDGTTYEVIGKPRPIPGARAVHHPEVDVRAISG